jgi:glycylpeptide N-tetradecanoyltransferase
MQVRFHGSECDLEIIGHRRIIDVMSEREIIANERADDESSEHEEEEVEASAEGVATSSKQKKKKKRSKAAKALAALTGKDKVPQEVVDEVLKKVKEEHGENAAGADEETVRKALDFLKINDVIKGKAGIGGRGRKDMGEHKVCLHNKAFSLPSADFCSSSGLLSQFPMVGL